MSILNRYRVLDLTDEKGMFCSKLLADMGAEVIRIQKPGEAVSNVYANSGKHSITLNIDTEPGREILKQLLKDTDIMVESFPPDYLDQLGIGWNQLNGVYPRLIMASITGFGQSGPYRNYNASDLIASAMGGQAYVNGEPGKPPLKIFGTQSYYTACLFAANGILLALWQRHSSGRGQLIDISIQECVAATLDHVLVRYFYDGEVAQRTGSLYWNHAFKILPCLDGYILLSLFHQWPTLVEWLESEGMAEDLRDKRYLDEAERRKDIGHVIQVLKKWTQTHSVDEILETGQLMRFPWARVATIPEVLDSPQLKARGFFEDGFDINSGKRYKYPGVPFKMSQSTCKVNPDVPRAGEYNREIYQNRLGLTQIEMERLISEGII